MIETEMGCGNHCTAECCELIQKLISSGKTYKQLQDIVGCALSMVRNALIYSPKAGTRGRQRVLSDKLAVRVARYAKQHQYSSSQQIKDKLSLSASIQAINRRAKEKILLIQKRNSGMN